MRIPSITDILKAAKTLRGKVRRTPLEYSHPLSKLTGGDVFLKLENQQHTNSFKIRGAMNKMYALSDKERQSGVVTASSGNHAQGLSYLIDIFTQGFILTLSLRSLICRN